MLTRLALLRALHWRPYEAGVACLVQLDAAPASTSTSTCRELGVVQKLALDQLWRNLEDTNKQWMMDFPPPSQQMFPMGSCDGCRCETEEPIGMSLVQQRPPPPPFAIPVVEGATIERLAIAKRPHRPSDNLAVGKALKRFLAEPVLVGILVLQYAAVIVVVLVISFTETH